MKMLTRTEIEDLLKLTDDENAIIIDGTVMTLDELDAKEVYTVKELKTILSGLKAKTELIESYEEKIEAREEEIREGWRQLNAIETSDWEHGHMGFPGEHINRPPEYIKKLAKHAYPNIKQPKKPK